MRIGRSCSEAEGENLRSALFPQEIEERDRDAAKRYSADRAALEAGD